MRPVYWVRDKIEREGQASERLASYSHARSRVGAWYACLPTTADTNRGWRVGIRVEVCLEILRLCPAPAGRDKLVWWFGETNRARSGRLRFEGKWRRSFFARRETISAGPINRE